MAAHCWFKLRLGGSGLHHHRENELTPLCLEDGKTLVGKVSLAVYSSNLLSARVSWVGGGILKLQGQREEEPSVECGTA